MLTQADIDDMKEFLADYDNYCQGRECQPDCCKVLEYVKSSDDRQSCFKAYCHLRRSGQLV